MMLIHQMNLYLQLFTLLEIPTMPAESKTQKLSEPPILGSPEPHIPSDPPEPHINAIGDVGSPGPHILDSDTESSTWTIVPSRKPTQKKNKLSYTNKRVENSTNNIF